MKSSRQVLVLIDEAVARCQSARDRSPIARHAEFDRVRAELLSWRKSVSNAWPPNGQFLEESTTLGVYAARHLWDSDRELAEAIVAVRAALKGR
jgi:hypothetical protein